MFRLGVPHEYRSSSPSNSHYTMLGDLEQPWRLTSSALTPDLSPRYARQSSVNDQFLGSAIFQPGALFRSEHLENYVLEVWLGLCCRSLCADHNGNMHVQPREQCPLFR